MKRNVDPAIPEEGVRGNECQHKNSFLDEIDQPSNENERLVTSTLAQVSKGSSQGLSFKIFAGIITICILFILNSILRQETSYYNQSTISPLTSTSCRSNLLLFLNQCVQNCPDTFTNDHLDNTCKPSNINPKQVKWGPISEASKLLHLSTKLVHVNQVTTGIVFFNDYKNYDMNFLLHHFNSDELQKFLIQSDASIFTFSGADQFYLKSEESIERQIRILQQQSPNIKRWLVCGIGHSGGFNALKYLLRLNSIFQAGFIIDPKLSLLEIPEAGLFSTDEQSLNLNGDILTAKENSKNLSIFGFVNQQSNSISNPFTPLFNDFNLRIEYFISNNFFDPIEKSKILQSHVFSLIEKFVSAQNKMAAFDEI